MIYQLHSREFKYIDIDWKSSQDNPTTSIQSLFCKDVNYIVVTFLNNNNN